MLILRSVLISFTITSVLWITSTTQAQTTCYGRAVTIYMTPGDTIASPGNQVILGTAEDEKIYAAPGDVVCGMGGNDYIIGSGRDEYGGIIALGGSGNDYIGGSTHGGDLIFGGQGNDYLFGGARSGAFPPNGLPQLDTTIYGDKGDDVISTHKKTSVNGGDGNDRCLSSIEGPNRFINCESFE